MTNLDLPDRRKSNDSLFLLFHKSQRKKVMKSNILKTVLLLADQARGWVRADSG